MKSINTVAAALGALVVTAAPAFAAPGDYTQIVCADPTTGYGTSTTDGLSAPASVASWSAKLDASACAREPMTRARALTMAARTPVTVEPGDFAALTYEVRDSGLALRGARYFRALSVDRQPPVVYTQILQHANADPASYAAPTDDASWRHMVPEHSFGLPDAPFNVANEARALVAQNRFTITLKCNRFDDGRCTHDAGDWTFRFFGAEAELKDLKAPRVEAVTGTLNAAVISGDAALAVSASDAGAGLYRARVVVDGKVREHRLVTDASPTCQDARPLTPDPYEFTVQKPCPAMTRESFRLDTRSLDDGVHRIQVVLEDAGGNEVAALDRYVEVRNAVAAAGAAPANPTSPQAAVEHVPQTPRTADLPKPAGDAPRPAQTGARLTLALAGARATVRRFTGSVRLTGRLVDRTGRPLADEPVTLVARDARPGASDRPIVVVRTRSDGRFTADAPPGPSRTFLAHYGDASARAKVIVRAEVSFRAGRARVGTPTWLTGRIRHLARAGVLVQIQALDGRRWRTFDTTKTRADGTFRYAYHFKAPARGRRFALRVLVDSPIYPFAPTASQHRWVTVR